MISDHSKMRFFDFEVLPNWWLCVFGDYPDGPVTSNCKKDFFYVTSDDKGARDKLIEYFKEDDTCCLGYNIKGYDLVIANGIYQGFSPQQIKILNDIIINPGCAYDTKEHIRMAPFAKKKLSGICYQDLMDDSSGSLKEKEATLGLNILESSVDFNKSDLTDDDKADLIYYCKQDVYAAMQFYAKVVEPYTKVKIAMGKHFNIPFDTCHKSTNARLVSMALGAVRKHYSDSERMDIDVPAKVKQYCYDNLPTKILERIRTSTDGFQVTLFDNEVHFGNGGIHSTYAPNGIIPPSLYLQEDDEHCLVNVDAASYYPSLMIQLNLLSRSVQNRRVFIDIFNERIAIKHKPNKTPEDDMAQKADKLVLNTTFGASGNKWLDLYDPYMCTSVCRVGQILLASLAYRIWKLVPTAKIIQTNTDGILVYVKRQFLGKIIDLQNEWTKVSGINMELDHVEKIWQRDVNNYLMIEEGGILKRKGGWLNNEWLRVGYVTVASANAFVCANAAIDYLIKGKDIVESIVKCTNLFDFTITCTKGPTYRGVVQRMADGKEVPLYKANRVIATKNKNYGKLYKIKMYKGNLSYTQMPSTPEHCYTVNKDMEEYDFNSVRKILDYMYYIERTYDLLDIEWYTLKDNILIRDNRWDIEK